MVFSTSEVSGVSRDGWEGSRKSWETIPLPQISDDYNEYNDDYSDDNDAFSDDNDDYSDCDDDYSDD